MLWVEEGDWAGICFLLTCCYDFTQPRSTVHAFLFLLVPLCGLILLMVMAYTASQAAIVLILTLFNRLNFI